MPADRLEPSARRPAEYEAMLDEAEQMIGMHAEWRQAHREDAKAVGAREALVTLRARRAALRRGDYADA